MKRSVFKIASGLSIVLVIITALHFSSVKKSGRATAPAPVYPLPAPEQMAWHEMELNAFIHFTTNTFTGLEWGKGSESPSIFNPTAADPGQWVRALKEAGFKQ